MPHRPRIKLADIPQHIAQRGINREPYFFAEEDYHCYLHWLKKSARHWESERLMVKRDASERIEDQSDFEF